MATADSATTLEDEVVVIDVLANDSDSDGDPWTIDSVVQGQFGTVLISDSGMVTYTPKPNYSGSDSFTYVITDGQNTSAPVTVTVTVSAVNDAPSFGDGTAISMTGSEVIIGGSAGMPVSDSDVWLISFAAPATDVEGDAISYKWELSESEDFGTILISIDATETGASITWAELLAVSPNMDAEAQVVRYQRVTATDAHGLSSSSAAQSVTFIRGRFTSTEGEGSIPTEFYLDGNYPNPFNPSTTIEFGLPEAAHVSLVVYDMRGRLIQTVVNGRRAPGIHHERLDMGSLPSGMYLYRLSTPHGSFSKMLTLMK